MRLVAFCHGRRGFGGSSSEDLAGDCKTRFLRVIKKNHVKRCLEMFAEIAEKKDDHKKFFEKFGR